jgi:hypothetical protein
MQQSTDDFLFNILMKFPIQIVYKKISEFILCITVTFQI